jgi:sugar diacid utilization regulator
VAEDEGRGNVVGVDVVTRGRRIAGGAGDLRQDRVDDEVGPAREVAGVRDGGSGWCVALVVASELRSAEQLARSLFPKAHIQLAARNRVPHLVVRVPLLASDQLPTTRKALARLTGSSGWSVLAVCPRADETSEDVERRRVRAQALLPLMESLPVARRVLDMDELLAFDILSVLAPEAQAGIVRRILGPVLDQPGNIGRRQLATLEALHWHDGSVKSAAKALGVHTKTIHNRLRRFEQLTGLWLDHPPDRLRIDMALYLWRGRQAGITAP